MTAIFYVSSLRDWGAIVWVPRLGSMIAARGCGREKLLPKTENDIVLMNAMKKAAEDIVIVEMENFSIKLFF